MEHDTLVQSECKDALHFVHPSCLDTYRGSRGIFRVFLCDECCSPYFYQEKLAGRIIFIVFLWLVVHIGLVLFTGGLFARFLLVLRAATAEHDLSLYWKVLLVDLHMFSKYSEDAHTLLFGDTTHELSTFKYLLNSALYAFDAWGMAVTLCIHYYFVLTLVCAAWAKCTGWTLPTAVASIPPFGASHMMFHLHLQNYMVARGPADYVAMVSPAFRLGCSCVASLLIAPVVLRYCTLPYSGKVAKALLGKHTVTDWIDLDATGHEESDAVERQGSAV
ncbi:hypothetical protein JCM10207_003248 [Rhodosporidiobolus poonsookiae]